VWDAVELLGADRIDHGVRAIDDPVLVQMLADRQIPLGVCPTSNLVLGVYPSIDAHPIERLRQAGVRVSVNTDDPALLGASLVGEYALCWQAFGWTDEVSRSVARTSIEATRHVVRFVRARIGGQQPCKRKMPTLHFNPLSKQSKEPL
jgi:adenosine deaminase